jgi:uncharacterized protein
VSFPRAHRASATINGALRLLLASLLAAVVLLLAPRAALADFTPPPFDGYVVDTAGKLSEQDRQAIDAKLKAYEESSTNQIAVLVTKSLEGDPIEDVAYRTARTWKVGQKGKDNGVLLVIAPTERKIRIETGKGVGGQLTDLQSNEIIRTKIAPRLKEERFGDAVNDGVDAIIHDLGDPTAPERAAARDRARTPPRSKAASLCASILPVGIVIFILFVIWLARRGGGGGGGSGGGGFFFFGGGGGGGDGPWGGGGGGGDGGGFSGGGGGDFGGGGAGGDY